MTAVTVLGAGGYPRPPAWAFGLKVGNKATGPFTVLGPQGVPRPPYGAFSGKGGNKALGPFTVLSAQGVPRPPYGSFSGKIPPIVIPQGGGTDKRKRRMALGITPDEWAILMAALEDDY